MKLLRSFLRAPIQINGKLAKRRKGVPQGSPLSPLLSNILLNELDKELEKRGHKYVRYADDLSIHVRLKKSAKRVGNSIYTYLRDKSHLPINREKSGICRPQTFNLLRYGFVPTYKKGDKGKYQLVAKKSKWAELKQKLKYLTKKTIPISFDERIKRLNRLRYCIWHHWKKPARKRKNLIRPEISNGQAYACSRTRMRGWAVAQSPIPDTTITVKRLKTRGYIKVWSNTTKPLHY